MNIPPNRWGPYAWVFLHSITLTYPDDPTEEEKQEYKNFFVSLQYILPCRKCRQNYQANLEKHRLDDHALKNKKNLTNWLIDIHNCVNKDTGKKVLDYDTALKYLNKKLKL